MIFGNYTFFIAVVVKTHLNSRFKESSKTKLNLREVITQMPPSNMRIPKQEKAI